MLPSLIARGPESPPGGRGWAWLCPRFYAATGRSSCCAESNEGRDFLKKDLDTAQLLSVTYIFQENLTS